MCQYGPRFAAYRNQKWTDSGNMFSLLEQWPLYQISNSSIVELQGKK